jgi:hypothetical protein
MPDLRFIEIPEFPKARFYPDLSLMCWFPTGILDDAGADRVLEFIETQEKNREMGFNRYLDMSGYDRIQISLDHVVRLARRRWAKFQGPPVRTAFFATRLIGLTIAKMYEELMEGSGIHVCTCGTRRAAAEWLDVTEEILVPPKDQPRGE